jgi:hypothetical protein
MSPTVLRIGSYRFFFYSGDRQEPPHIHIEYQGNIAKIWLDPVRLQSSRGYMRKELNDLIRLVEEHREEIRSYWDEFFHD